MVGIGPGGRLDRTFRAQQAIEQSEVVVGYGTYLDLISDLTEGKEVVSSGMKKEIERCRAALHAACGGQAVALVSSGDPGIYGMAGLAFELAAAEGLHVEIEIVPGVSAAGAVAPAWASPGLAGSLAGVAFGVFGGFGAGPPGPAKPGSGVSSNRQSNREFRGCFRRALFLFIRQSFSVINPGDPDQFSVIAGASSGVSAPAGAGSPGSVGVDSSAYCLL